MENEPIQSQNRKNLVYSALIGLVFFGIFQLAKPLYYRPAENDLAQKLRAQVAALSAAANDDQKIVGIQDAKDTTVKLERVGRKLSGDSLQYEKNYIILESLEKHYQYQQELNDLTAKIFEYNPENDLNGRSVLEYKGDFMYRLSLAQYALKQITAKLKKYDKEPGLADYTKRLVSQLPPMIDLIDRLVTITSQNQITESNHFRSQYITDFKQLQAVIRPLTEQILKEIDAANQKLLSEIKI